MEPKLNEHEPLVTPEQRVMQCSEAIEKALIEYNCQIYTALKVGNAETPLGEIAGLPLVVKLAVK